MQRHCSAKIIPISSYDLVFGKGVHFNDLRSPTRYSGSRYSSPGQHNRGAMVANRCADYIKKSLQSPAWSSSSLA